MTDRGLPIVDGAPACPFVAFDDDRDERAASPDVRHRCYAEVRPAPRAHAHQDAYCLSSAFAICPTFQDWARREGARVRETGDRRLDPRPPRRNPQRDWQAPPPWMAGEDEDAGGPASSPRSDWRGESGSAGRPPEAGLAGSLAHQIAMGGAPAEPEDAAWDAASAERGGSRGAGRPADSNVAPPARPATPYAADRGMEGGWGATDEPEAMEEGPDPDEPPVHVGRTSGFSPSPGRSMVSKPGPRRRSDDAATPPWERPRRFEAYPTLRTRVGLPAPSRTVMLFVALVLAAAGLFFLPTFLGFNSPQGSPSPVPSASRSPLPTLAPTPTVDPGPTPQVYIIQPNDTLSGIAARFGVPLADLIAANQETLPDPNKIKVGDSLIIPVPVPTTFPDAGTPVPSTAP